MNALSGTLSLHDLLEVRAGDFLVKDINVHDLRTALDQLVAASTDDPVSALPDPEALTDQEQERAKALEHITEREIAFFHHVCDARELTYEQIADLMNVHRRTVDGYREAIFKKLRIKSKVGLVLFALKWGIVKV